MTTTDPFDLDDGRAPESEAAGDGDERPPVGLTLLAGAVVAAVVVPVVWIGVMALSVDPGRAVSMVFRARTLEILLNTLVLVGLVTTFSVLLGVPLAVLTTLTDLPHRRFWTVALALPLVIPSFTSAFAFISVWGPRGMVQSALEPFGVHSLPEIYGLWGTVFILTLYNYPFVYLTTVAGLRAFDKTYLDAGRSLETSRFRAFRRVVLPLVKPAVAAGTLLTALETAGDFGVPAMLRFDVFTRQIYLEHNALAGDYAALLSLHLVAIALVILALESQVRGHETIHGGARGESRSYAVRLGWWVWPARLLCGLVVTLSVVLPVVFLSWWLFHGPESYVGSLAFRWEYAINSATVSALSAVAAAALALPIAYLAARYRSSTASVLERASYVGFAVPGIVIGLALVSGASAHAPAIYQTLPLVVFAYVVLYLPLAVGAARASFLYVNPRLTEAARSLGCSPLEAFRRVTLPLVVPGIVAGGALVFLHAMKELPATLLLRPAGFESLATFIWMAERNAYYGYAAVPALVLVFVSGLAVLGLFPREEGYRRLLRRRTRSPDDGSASGGDRSGVPSRETIADGDGRPLERGRATGESSPASRPAATGSGPAARGDRADPVVVLESVTRRYGRETAVEGLSLSVREGELLTLVGPSGCGKTTTLRLIAGLEYPDAGRIELRGETVADGSTRVPCERRDVGIVFQEFALFPHRTVAENVAFGLEDEDEGVVDELLELVGLAPYRDGYPDELSGGQKQRVALARSLAPEPDVLLLDEPLSNLDAGLRVRMRETVRRIVDAVGVTAVWVTHDQAEALSVGDRTAVLHEGAIEQVGPPREVFMQPASRRVADFLGRASYLEGRLSEGGVETPIGSLERDRLSLSAADVARPAVSADDPGRVSILLRPDDLAVEPATAERADGRLVHRGFTGSTVRYRIELADGTVLESRCSHEEWLAVGTPVAVSIAAGHRLPTFPADG
ncbi:ATP-binding cassette domain-containing protein [Natrononativus amylolyticus]|uniref:ATP-binding cassette domain-containing protein n=1 Tax=Natrononativus amylolyticus TaxID=2963434 RepID=UPI0020CF1684|nr:ATP-binding cassette domain-containing protein [Natrononativus amylolyticus]